MLKRCQKDEVRMRKEMLPEAYLVVVVSVLSIGLNESPLSGSDDVIGKSVEVWR